MKYFIILIVCGLSLIGGHAFAQDTPITDPDIIELLLKIIDYGTTIIGVASIITAATPNSRDNQIVQIFKVLLDALAFNFGFARTKKA